MRVLQAQVLQAQPMMEHQASTSLNIAILDSKDFPGDIAPLPEIYSEFTMVDGRVLFECPGLVKATGIDLMNCPLDVVLKLRVRRRMPQGAVILWYVVLPLHIISKYLLNPPYEWETWIGLFPNTQSPDGHAPEMLFTQAVHLISRPEFPKLRVRFTYHNPELQAQKSAQREAQELESRRRVELTQQVGRAQFEEIHKLTRTFRDTGLTERDGSEPAGAGTFAVDRRPTGAPHDPAATVLPAHGGRSSGSLPASWTFSDVEERLREALQSTLRFVSNVRQMLLHEQCHDPGMLPVVPPLPDSVEVLANSMPAQSIETHCQLLQQHLCTALASSANRPGRGLEAIVGTKRHPCAAAEAEPLLVEGLRMALLGTLEDPSGGQIPRKVTNLSTTSNDQLVSIQGRFPALWEAYREVSAMAKERANLIEAVSTLSKEQQHHGPWPNQHAPRDTVLQAESRRQFEKLLAQQRQALQLTFANDLGILKQLLEDKDADCCELRAQLEHASRVAG
mmetsp:Transcript_55157/g.155201  ORF Transcript_55157/g.155201 Transcript_55157/m.155201 type:complete len:507 (-) Transcript_55157:70-1590(-)